MHDVIIIGGSYAGLSAALQLGRARRKVLVLDAGKRRNRFASSSHGFLGQDGQSPEAIAEKGRAEVLAYPTTTWREGAAIEASAISDGFAVRTESEELRTKRLILATGVVDELPSVPGVAERWGKTVFHCPYCHGYELGRGRLGVLATSPHSMHSAILVSEWAAPGELTFFLNGAFEPNTDDLAALASREIRVERTPVRHVGGEAPAAVVHLDDEREIPLRGLFLLPKTHVQGPFAAQLGCELEEGPLGRFYKTDATKETTVPGVFACGDAAVATGGVSLAVAAGTLAGVAAHRSLIFR